VIGLRPEHTKGPKIARPTASRSNRERQFRAV
jgi:hypothetical protein